MKSASFLLVLLVLPLFFTGVQAQIPQQPSFGIVVQSFKVVDTTVFENQTFSVSLSLYNNGSMTYSNISLIISEQSVSFRDEGSSSTPLLTTTLGDLKAGDTMNLTLDLESTSGNKLLSISFIYANKEIPTTATASINVLTAPVGDNETLFWSLGIIFFVLFALVSLQWIPDLLRRTMARS